MKKKHFHAATLVLFLLAIVTAFSAQRADAAVSWQQKAASIFPHSTTDFDSDSFRQAVRNLQGTGANEVALIVPIYQACDSCSDIYAGGDTPTDASLTSAINFIHSLGMKVVLKPHLGAQSGSGWRATIDASNRDAWFASYGNYINHLGDIGNQTGAEGMVVGTELISMADYTVHSDNTARWDALIASLRTHFHGFLTYSANWGWSSDPSDGNFVDEIAHVGFWDKLDYIGISAYFPQSQGQDSPSVASMVGNWGWWDQNVISPLAQKYGKQVVFTEIGYNSVHGAHNAPCCSWSGSYDGAEQANDYEALFQYWASSGELAGIYIWNWDSDPNYGGQGNQDYTPWKKPAQQNITSWFGGSGNPSTGGGTGGNNGGGTGGNNGGSNGGGTSTTTTTTPPPTTPPTTSAGGGDTTPPPSSVTGTFSVTATAPTLAAGQPATVHATVNSTGSATNVIVDLEIYDSNGSKVAQKFFENQSITSSHPGSYSIDWTPASNGNYTLKTGIFKSDWSTNYYWNDGVLALPVGQGGNGGPPSTGPLTTDIWWPSDGATVSGTQPFKVLVEGKMLSDYTEYWQVDGDQLNQMFDSQTDAPHKEAIVDLSSWTWKGSGPYTVTFVAKDSGGNVISSRSVNITVSH